MPKAMLSKLPDKAKDIYEAAWQEAQDAGHDDETAAKIAIGAVKRAGYSKDLETGMWAKMHMVHWHITKATVEEGIMRWHGTVSKCAVDVQGDEITPDFIKYAWSMVQKGHRPAPVVCLSHIDKGQPSDAWVAGDTEEIYVDGQVPKAKGTFRDTPLGKAAFTAVVSDIQADAPHGERARFSMGFYDEGSQIIKSRRSDGKEATGRRYFKGWIKHLALTRVPVVRETSIQAIMEEKAMAKKVTKRDDAATIGGDELADGLVGAAEKAELLDTELILKQEEDETKGRKGGPEAGGPGGTCVCPECGHEATHETGKSCADVECSECGAKMTRAPKEEKGELGDGAAEKSVSIEDFTYRVRDAWGEQFPGDRDEIAKVAESDDGGWVSDVMDDAVIVRRKGSLYKASYVVDTESGKISFGAPVKVTEVKTFVPAVETPITAQVPRVAVKADLETNPGATRRDQVKALLASLETLLLEGLDEHADEANRAALGQDFTNPPTTVEMSEVTDTPPDAQVVDAQPADQPVTDAGTHPAEVFVDNWAMRVKSVLLSDADRTEKFATLQHAFDEFGEGVKSLVTDDTPASGRDMADVIQEAVRMAVEPVYNELAGVKAELAEALQARNTAVPQAASVPRAMDGRAVVMPDQNLPTSMPPGVGQGTALRHKALSASELAWQSTAEPLGR